MKQHIARLTSGILAILLLLAVVPGNAKAEASAENLFSEAVQSLTDVYGVFEKAQTGTMSSPEDEWFAPGGVISATVLDFDSDGETEMLVFVAQPGRLDSYQITMQMYEIQNNKAVAVATAPLGCPYGDDEMKLARQVFTLDRNNFELAQLCVTAVQTESKCYILGEYSGDGRPFASGSDAGYWVMEYTNGAFQDVCAFARDAGSDPMPYTVCDFENGKLKNIQAILTSEHEEYYNPTPVIADYFSGYGMIVDLEHEVGYISRVAEMSPTAYKEYSSILTKENKTTRLFCYSNRWVNTRTYFGPYTFEAVLESDPLTAYIYDTPDPGADVELNVETLFTVTDTASAVDAVETQTASMTAAQKESATGADFATLYAETAVAYAASQPVEGRKLIIEKAAIQELEKVASQTSAAVDTALVNGGVTTARIVSNTVRLTTDETGEITVKIDSDVLETTVDKVIVQTPTYALTFNLSDLAEDLQSGVVTFKSETVSTVSGASLTRVAFRSSAPASPTVKVTMPGGKTSNPVTVSMPTNVGDVTYQTVVNEKGAAVASKYNPATQLIGGKVTVSGTYTVKTNEKDFTDIANKSAEMQTAIRYLASKGIINGTSETTFTPDGSISRAEIAALIVRALGKLDNNAVPSFVDVTEANWFYAVAASSAKCGIIKGYDDNTFRGNQSILKEQILVVAARVLKEEMGYKEPSETTDYLAKYSDEVVAWARPEVALATRENLVVYRADGTFSGTKTMTRGDAAIILYRLFMKLW